MTDTSRRRALLAGVPVGVAGLAALTGVIAPVAHAAEDAVRPAGPEGTWEFAIDISNGQPTEYSNYALTADGIVVHVSNNGLLGLGQWQRSRNGFVIGFREWLTDNAGVVEGTIRVRLDCVPVGGGVRVTGTAIGYDLAGNKIFEGTATGTGSRYGIDP